VAGRYTRAFLRHHFLDADSYPADIALDVVPGIMWCTTTPSAVDANGMFFIPWARPRESRKVALDSQVGENLWSFMENETKEY
jgi:hypothetical protein